MQKLTGFLFLLLISVSGSGQTNYEKFKTLLRTKDTAKTAAFLAEWERTDPGDPELYASATSFYFIFSREEMLSLDNSPKNKESLVLKDSTGNIAGYMNTIPGFNPDKLKKATHYANTGIEKFPDRLDIRFGKCYLLEQTGNYSGFTNEIIKTVEYSRVNGNKWLWSENKKLEDAEAMMLESVHSYMKDLYNTEEDSLLVNMTAIGEAVLKLYPSAVEIISITSVALMLTNDYDKAIAYLKQAEKINPKDFIVLNNIAHAYKRKGDRENAIKYFKLTAKYGDQEAKEAAAKNIKELSE